MFTTSKPDYRLAETEALGLLEEAGIENPPVNPVKLARDFAGVTVSFVTFLPESSAKVSGFYDCEENAIFVNSEESPLRQTFTVAHELGHKILHAEWAKSEEYKVLLRNPELRSQDYREKEANAFAANLLMPRFMMDRYWGVADELQLSRLFAVSVPAVKARLSFLYGV